MILQTFLSGALAMACLVVAGFFLALLAENG